MIQIIVLIIAIYLIYFIGKLLIKFVKYLYAFPWRDVRPKDAAIAGGVICAIILFEWLIPSTQLTGMHVETKQEPIFFIAHQPDTKRGYTPTEIAQSAPWLQHVNLSEKEFLEKSTQVYENKIPSFAEELTKLEEQISEYDKQIEAIFDKRIEAYKQKVLTDATKQKSDDNDFEKFVKFLDDTPEQTKLKQLRKGLENKHRNLKYHLRGDYELKLKFTQKSYETQFEQKDQETNKSIQNTTNTAPVRFPKIPSYFEIITDADSLQSDNNVITGPKSGAWSRHITAFSKFLKNDVRHHHTYAQEFSCGIFLDDQDGQLKSKRLCELIHPLPIDMDITAKSCPKGFEKNSEYMLFESENDKLETRCIEAWKFPFLRIQFTKNQISIFEPAPQASLNSNVYENGLPLSTWQIKIPGQNTFTEIDKLLSFPMKAIDFKNDIKMVHTSQFSENSDNENPIYYWQNWKLDFTAESPVFAPNRTEDLNKFKFKSYEFQFSLSSLQFQTIRDFLNSNLQVTLQDEIDDTELVENLYRTKRIFQKKFNSLENYLWNEYASFIDGNPDRTRTRRECHLSRYMVRDITKLRAKYATKRELENLLDIVISKGTGKPDCEKYNALSAMFESTLLYMDTNLPPKQKTQ